MGLHFIFSGAAHGEPGVIASLQENPIQLEKVARGFGWSLDDERVTVMYRSPNDVYVDEWVYELLDLVETTGATRVMIDSLSDLQYATPDPVRFREFVYSLTQRLSRAGISPIMTSEIPDLFHVGRLAEYGISHLSDNVILLQYLRADITPPAHRDDPQVTRKRPRPRGPRVRDHPGRNRPRRSDRQRPRVAGDAHAEREFAPGSEVSQPGRLSCLLFNEASPDGAPARGGSSLGPAVLSAAGTIISRSRSQ